MAFHKRSDRTHDQTLSRPGANSKLTQIRNGFYVGGIIVAPIVKAVAVASGIPGVDILSSIVSGIFQIAQQISLNKKQSLSLAQEARKTLEALKGLIAREGEVLEKDLRFVATLEQFATSVCLFNFWVQLAHHFTEAR